MSVDTKLYVARVVMTGATVEIIEGLTLWDITKITSQLKLKTSEVTHIQFGNRVFLARDLIVSIRIMEEEPYKKTLERLL